MGCDRQDSINPNLEFLTKDGVHGVTTIKKSFNETCRIDCSILMGKAKTPKFAFKLATVKKDRCGDFWVMIAVEGDRSYPKNAPPPSSERILVGVDMGLKTTRTAVRIRFFDRSYLTLVLASRHDKRALPFVHREIVRLPMPQIQNSSPAL
jgi:hypothetical protein